MNRRVAAGAMVLVLATPGCSFIFTRGPPPTPPPEGLSEPPRAAPPDCTSSVAAPVVDTVLGTMSLALLVAGIAGVAYKEPSCTPGEWFCGFGRGYTQAVGGGAIIVGTITGAIFIASAAVGYQRTAACRAVLESSEQRLPAPRTSVHPAAPREDCPVDDAPRLCSRVAWWPASEASGRGAPE